MKCYLLLLCFIVAHGFSYARPKLPRYHRQPAFLLPAYKAPAHDYIHVDSMMVFDTLVTCKSSDVRATLDQYGLEKSLVRQIKGTYEDAERFESILNRAEQKKHEPCKMPDTFVMHGSYWTGHQQHRLLFCGGVHLTDLSDKKTFIIVNSSDSQWLNELMQSLSMPRKQIESISLFDTLINFPPVLINKLPVKPVKQSAKTDMAYLLHQNLALAGMAMNSQEKAGFERMLGCSESVAHKGDWFARGTRVIPGVMRVNGNNHYIYMSLTANESSIADLTDNKIYRQQVSWALTGPKARRKRIVQASYR